MLTKQFSGTFAALIAAGCISMASGLWAQTTEGAAEDAQTGEAAQSQTSEGAQSGTTDEAQTGATEDAQADDSEGNQTSNEEIESQLSLGESADAPEGLGKPYTKEVTGAWELRCLKTETPEQDPCQMYQLMDDGQGAPVAEFSLFRLPGEGRAKAGATVIVPLETSLQNQLTVQIDGGTAKRYPFAFCNQLGCYSRIGLTEEDVNAFKRGREAVITIVPALAPDQEVKLTMSLDGFTASYEKVSVIEQ